jgi:hypothetical protein
MYRHEAFPPLKENTTVSPATHKHIHTNILNITVHALLITVHDKIFLGLLKITYIWGSSLFSSSGSG